MLARTDFLRIVAVAGAGWTLGLETRTGPAGAAAGDWSSLGWVSLDDDGIATVMVNKAEMGQGVTTSLPMLVAEELELPLDARALRARAGRSRAGTRPVATPCRPAAAKASSRCRR